jgi:hypothetical protein
MRSCRCDLTNRFVDFDAVVGVNAQRIHVPHTPIGRRSASVASILNRRVVLGHLKIGASMESAFRSDQTWEGNDMDHCADDLAELTEKLGLRDAIHGHSSSGGEVADVQNIKDISKIDIAQLSAAPN